MPSWETVWRMQLIMQTLESFNAFEKCLDFMSSNAMKCDCGAFSYATSTKPASHKRLGIYLSSFWEYATSTKPASHKRLGIYLSSFWELTRKFTIITKTIFFIGENYKCPLHMPAYAWPAQFTLCGNGCIFTKTKPQSIITMALS